MATPSATQLLCVRLSASLYRIGGRFILTAPAKNWAEAVRPEHERQKTSFRMSGGDLSQVYSFTFDMEKLEHVLAVCGLTIQEREVALLCDLPQNTEISPVLIDASQKLGRTDVPILNMVCALKESREQW